LPTFWSFQITYSAHIKPANATLIAPRARGLLRLSAKRRGAETAIANLRQEGSLKALFPKIRGNVMDAVFLNTAGGLTGGDRMQIVITAQDRTHVVLSSQAAERAYRAQADEVAQVDVTLDVHSGGRIDWLPQETILFDHAALSRRTTVNLAQDATVWLVVPVVFGRVALGERVTQLCLTDQWRVHREGRLIFADAIRLIGDAEALMQRLAIGHSAGAMATILLAGVQAEACHDRLALLPSSGASLIDEDLLLVRLLATDGFALRRQMIPVIEALTDQPIPRVWRL
jgi:urease accessory protein